jgi:hypothetical protein
VHVQKEEEERDERPAAQPAAAAKQNRLRDIFLGRKKEEN